MAVAIPEKTGESRQNIEVIFVSSLIGFTS